ncbi:hypothetical protein IWZ01DRAFT_565386 [Phyllosticta capitalensis]
MPSPFDPDDLSRFSRFSIHTTPYKTVGGSHAITTDVLIPRSLLTSPSPSPPRPLLLRFHGGAPASSRPSSRRGWLLQLAGRARGRRHRSSRPATGCCPKRASADVEDVWRWVKGEDADEEAGGGGLKRSATAAYPMLDMRSAHFSTSYAKPMFGLPMQPRSLYDAHVAAVRSGDRPGVISADPRCERFELMFCVPQNGICSELFPADERAWVPFEVVEDGARLPRGGLFVAHGAGDDVVPIEGSTAFERLVRERDGEVRFVLAVREGGHGFDAAASVDDEWMREGLRGVVQAWLEE